MTKMQYITHTQTGKIYIIDNGCSPSQIYKRYNPEGMAISERSIGRLLSGEKKEILGYKLSSANYHPDAVTYASEYDKDLAANLKLQRLVKQLKSFSKIHYKNASKVSAIVGMVRK